MKNIKEIADILGVSKMTVYRFIKTSNISESAVEGRTMLYDDTSVSAIIKAFYDKKDATHDTIDDTSDYAQEYLKKLEEMNAFFKKEIEDKKQQLKAKDEQIERLQIILDQQQQLSGTCPIITFSVLLLPCYNQSMDVVVLFVE